ncbi:MAG: ParB N-terminal domain-containing protein [Caulobacteraceae bacterium]|jgi:ParB family chromosome partitioning protein|nr:ParB N-terminal domain-containing protein [Caulobacteraceae bacterium]MBP6688474.1 ParB N-terminal domain-containing protein [Hyphomonadaceae bacterium]MBP9233659.1 ParB N-terminal domain-containing protein [Hyphomonadaceae bacterium]
MTTEILDTTRETQRAYFVPVSKLVVHDDNVRRTDKRADIEALAASIAAHGLLQNLSVVRIEDGRYAVVAGARRLAALRFLIKQGRLARDFAAACTIVEPALSAEASLAENVQRVAMNAMDEMEAFSRLADEGMSVEVIAERFGAQVRHVEQRLALGRLSPKIRAAYRKRELTLDVARAFCLTDDHGAQERLFKQVPKPISHAPSIRNALSGGRAPATDRLARFVGLNAYEAAGGRVVRDLFEDEVAFLEDGELLQRLAAERIEGMRESLASEGWSWVEAQLHHGQIEGCASERVRPRTRPLTQDESQAVADLEAEIESLDNELETDADNEALWTARDAAEARLDALQASFQTWDQAELAHAGAVITIDRNGDPIIARGLIKRADLKAIRKVQRATTAVEGDAENEPRADGEREKSTGLPRSLVERLTSARTRALRAELSANPQVALALNVMTLIRRSAARTDMPGLAITVAPVGFEDDDRFERERADASTAHADADLARLASEPPEKLLQLLALFIAEALDVTHDGGSPSAERTQATADDLASVLDLDMSRYWEASAEFWEKAPKAYTIEAISATPAMAKLSEKARKPKLAALTKMKRADLARVAQRQIKDWLPDVLITPPRSGAFTVTPSGQAAVAHTDAA